MYKIPYSVLVVIYTPHLDVLLLERSQQPDFWQSVTGSKDSLEETDSMTAKREVWEETGLDTAAFVLSNWGITHIYDIYPIWRHRYAPGVMQNTEVVFGLQVSDNKPLITLSAEHSQFCWLPYKKAANLCFSDSNKEAILSLPQYQHLTQMK